MAFTLTSGYIWVDGEVITAAKLNLAGVPTIADGQSYTFAAGSAAAPSIGFTGGTTTGFYLGSSSIGFAVAGGSVGTWSASKITFTVASTFGILGAFSSGNGDLDFDLTDSGGGSPQIRMMRASTAGTQFNIYSPGTANLLASFNALIACGITGDLVVSNGLYRTTSDFTASATTTLADITGLSATLVSSGIYYFRARLLGSGSAVPTAGGVKVAISGTCTATEIIAGVDGSFGTSATTPYYRSVVSALNATVSNTPTVDTALDMSIEGTIKVNAGGTLTIQMAQVTASGVTTVSKGSTLWLQRLS